MTMIARAAVSISLGVISLAAMMWQTIVVALKSKVFWTGMLIWACFWPFALTLPRAYLFDLVNAFSVCVSVGVLIAYLPGIKTALSQKRRMTGGQYLVLGIACTWLATACRHLLNWVWRYMGKPDWLIDHPLVAFLIFMVVTGGFLHLSASEAIEDEVPQRSWRKLGLYVALSLAVGAFFIVYFEPTTQRENRPQSSTVLEGRPAELWERGRVPHDIPPPGTQIYPQLIPGSKIPGTP